MSQQFGLLKDLLTLLHVGSDRVQRQVTSLLRRMLPEISPEHLAQLLHIGRMPPLDFSVAYQTASDAFDMYAEGIIDIFLVVIAKSLQLQMKVKGSTASNGGQHKNLTTLRMDQCIEWTQPSDEDGVADREDELDAIELLDEFSADKRAADRSPSASRWFLRGQISSKQADNLITLLRDLSMVGTNQ